MRKLRRIVSLLLVFVVLAAPMATTASTVLFPNRELIGEDWPNWDGHSTCRASQSLTAENIYIVPGSDIKFHTNGGTITLKEGFSVANGAKFYATSDPNQLPDRDNCDFVDRLWDNNQDMADGSIHSLIDLTRQNSGDRVITFVEDSGDLSKAKLSIEALVNSTPAGSTLPPIVGIIDIQKPQEIHLARMDWNAVRWEVEDWVVARAEGILYGTGMFYGAVDAATFGFPTWSNRLLSQQIMLRHEVQLLTIDEVMGPIFVTGKEDTQEVVGRIGEGVQDFGDATIDWGNNAQSTTLTIGATAGLACYGTVAAAALASGGIATAGVTYCAFGTAAISVIGSATAVAGGVISGVGGAMQMYSENSLSQSASNQKLAERLADHAYDKHVTGNHPDADPYSVEYFKEKFKSKEEFTSYIKRILDDDSLPVRHRNRPGSAKWDPVHETIVIFDRNNPNIATVFRPKLGIDFFYTEFPYVP